METITWSAAEVKIITAAASAGARTQPWRLRIRNGSVDVLPVYGAGSVADDAATRALGVSCGMAVFNIRVALARLGYGTTTTYLRLATSKLPTIRVHARHRGLGEVGDLGDLFDAVHKDAAGELFGCARRIPVAVLEPLQLAARQEGSSLRLVRDPVEHDLLSSLARLAEYGQSDRPRAAADGSHFIPEDRLLQHPSSYADCLCEAPDMALLQTRTDAPEDWIATGQALRRVLLAAAAHQVALSWGRTAMEFADLRWRVPTIGGRDGYPQVLLRIHYPVVYATLNAALTEVC